MKEPSRKPDRKATLALADGTTFPGFAWGCEEGSTVGEVVFTTGLTGYQETLTDPSYSGQIVTMTAPHIGNTGINTDDQESLNDKPQVSGFIVRAPSPLPSNHRSRESLDAYLARHGVVGISGVDTRRLTRYLRDKGSQNGCIGTEDPAILVDRARAAPNMDGLDLVARVTPKDKYSFTESRGDWRCSFDPNLAMTGPSRIELEKPFHVVAMDFGAKRNILRCLVDSGCRVTGVPANTAEPESTCSPIPPTAAAAGRRAQRSSSAPMGRAPSSSTHPKQPRSGRASRTPGDRSSIAGKCR